MDPVTGCGHEPISSQRNDVQMLQICSHPIGSWHGKFVTLKGILFLLQEISVSDQFFLLGNLILQQEFSSSLFISYDSN